MEEIKNENAFNSTDLPFSEDYEQFKQEFNITLNEQQQNAVTSADKATLLLAVPGSGKTTVLINKIAFMILKRGINPKNILALTYNVSACRDMKQRFASYYGKSIQVPPEFRTLNSISLQIYRTYCRMKNFKERELFEDKQRTLVIRQIYTKVSGNMVISENDTNFLSSHFTYIKNMGLNEDEIIAFNKDMPKFDEMYSEYRKYLKSNYKMDFDDQLVLAHWILSTNPQILRMYRDRYKYILVDEAQDTSKIQHEIIALLAQGNNIFMVGDEDQSIYGFRAAYPQALLKFSEVYNKAKIIKMEYNYRSVAEITAKASLFINKNTDRFEKNIIPVRTEHGIVNKIKVNSRAEQYQYLLDAARHRKSQTAFLYRDNASSIVLIDLFLRNSIPFIHRSSDMNFFETKTVLDMLSYLRLLINPYDWQAFERICNKGILFLKHHVKNHAIGLMKNENITYFDAVKMSFPLIDPKTHSYVSKGLSVLKNINSSLKAKSIISLIRLSGYDQYMQKQKINTNNIDVLELLAEKESGISEFLNRIDYLAASLKDGFYSKDNPIILSTIHSSKGLEYETVYMVDVFDGVFPASPPSLNGNMSDEELEERRIFYVGITRAKTNLYLMKISSSTTSFIDELFPTDQNKIAASNHSSAVKYAQLTTKQLNERRLKRQNQKILDARCFDEVKHKFKDGVKIVTDSTQRDWVICDRCHKIKLSKYFYSYSDYGCNICCDCSDKQ